MCPARLYRLAAMSSALTMLSLWPRDANAQPCQASISGSVVERFEDVEEPFPLFHVDLELTHPQHRPRRTQTNLNGQFLISGLCPGSYELSARLKGYRPLSLTIQTGQRYDLVLALDEEATAPPGATVQTNAAPARVDTHSRAQLEAQTLDMKTGESLGQALKRLPGVNVIETGTVAKPVIHGMHSNRVVILYDGLRHASQSWGLDHAPEIDPFSASRISVIRGAAGVRYGPDAIGGLILIEPEPLHSHQPPHGALHMVGLSNGRQGAAAASLGGDSELLSGLGWRLQGSAKKAGALQTPDYVLDNTGSQELNLSGAIGLERASWQGKLTGSYYWADTGFFTGIVSDNAAQFRDAIEQERPRGVENYRFDYDRERPRQQSSHLTLKAQGSRRLDSGGQLEGMVAYQHNSRAEYDIVRGDISAPQLDFTLRTTDLSLVWSNGPGSLWRASAGAQGTWQDNLFEGRRFIPNYRALGAGAFAWLRYMGEAAEVEMGIRLDGESMDTFQRAAIGGPQAPIERDALSFLTPSAVLGVIAQPSEALKLSANLSSTSRAPTIDELFIDGVSQGVASFIRGDKTLRPEQTYAASASLDLEHRLIALNVSPYLQYIDGYIYAAPALGADGAPALRLTVNGSFPSLAMQQVDAIFAGVDAEVRLLPLPWLELATLLTIVRAKDVSRDDYLVFIPPDQLSQELNLKAKALGPLKEPGLSLIASYTAEQTRVDLNADFAPPPKDYLLFDAQVFGSISTSLGELLASLEIKNITNLRYRNYMSRLRYFTLEPGRSINARLKLSF